MDSIGAFMKQLVGSVAHPEFYREAIQRPVVKALVYLLLLYICMCTVIGVKIYFDTSRFIDGLTAHLQTKVPDFVLQDATLAVHAKMPYVVEDSAEEHLFAVIDTSGKLNEGVLAKYEHGYFVSAHKLVWKINAAQTFSFDFPPALGVKFMKQDIVDSLPMIKYFLVFRILLLTLVVGYVGQLITCWVLAVLGSVIATVMNFPITPANLFKIAIYSYTFPLIVSVPIALFVPAVLPLGFSDAFGLFSCAFYYGVPVVYLITVVQFLRDQQQQ